MLLRLPILFMLLFSSNLLFSQLSDSHTEKKKTDFKAIYIKNFIKYTEWPEDSNEEFVIGIVEDKLLFDRLSETVDIVEPNGIAAGNKKHAVVKYMSDLKDAESFHLIYVPVSSGYSASALFEAIGKQAILLVTEEFPANSTMVNFKYNDDLLKYELNKANISKQGLKVSENLENLAIDTSVKGN